MNAIRTVCIVHSLLGGARSHRGEPGTTCRRHRATAWAIAAVLLLLSGGLPVSSAAAQTPPTPQTANADGRRVLTIGTKEAPPFAMKSADGSWSGLSIDLWGRLAKQLNLGYRLVEYPAAQDLVDHVADGTLDGSVAAITVTAGRAGQVDFTQPYYRTGLGVAVAFEGGGRWLTVLNTLASFGFAQAVGVLVGIALLVGLLVWAFEHKHTDHFGGGPRGLGSSVWWSAVAMTQAGAGENAPATLPGRLVAVVWMIASIIAISVFTAGITSALTTKELDGRVREASDLHHVRVGAVGGSSSVDYLDRERIRFSAYPTAADGLHAVQDGKIDAFVYDKPLLSWVVRQNFPSTVRVLDLAFDQQDYAIAVPIGSPLRRPASVALLNELQSDWWRRARFTYFGEND